MSFVIDALPQEDFRRARRDLKGGIAMRSTAVGLCLLKGVIGAGAVVYIGHTDGGEIVPGISLKDFSNVFAPVYLGVWTAMAAKEVPGIRRNLDALRRLTSFTSTRITRSPATLSAPTYAIGQQT